MEILNTWLYKGDEVSSKKAEKLLDNYVDEELSELQEALGQLVLQVAPAIDSEYFTIAVSSEFGELKKYLIERVSVLVTSLRDTYLAGKFKELDAFDEDLAEIITKYLVTEGAERDITRKLMDSIIDDIFSKLNKGGEA